MLECRPAVMLLLAASGCSSVDDSSGVATTVAGCLTQFAANKGYDYRSDPGVASPSMATPGVAGSANSDSRSPFARAIADCQAARGNLPDAGTGVDCEPARILSRDAAICAARALGLVEAKGYAAAIGFDSGFSRIVWVVRNTTERSAGTASGDQMILDAVTAKMLETGRWSGIE